MIKRSFLFALILLCPEALLAASASPSVVGERDARDLLMRMNRAFVEEDYDGVFTYYSGDEMASLRVVHKIVDGVQRERLVHLNGAPREILRHGDEVVCIVQPGDDIAVLEESIPAGPFARAFVREFDRASASYKMETMGEGRVADRTAVRVSLTPIDQFRYGYRLWLDKSSALLLRSEMIDADGQRLEVFQFSHLKVGSQIPDASLEAQDMSGSMVSHLTLRKDRTESVEPGATQRYSWKLGWVPPGFRMAVNDIRNLPSRATFSSMMYTDGLATFSIFIEAMPADGAASMVSQNGATVALTKGLRHGKNMYLATLVGEIPVVTGQRVLDSVKSQ